MYMQTNMQLTTQWCAPYQLPGKVVEQILTIELQIYDEDTVSCTH